MSHTTAVMLKIPHIEEPSIRMKAIKYFVTLFCALYFFQGFITGIVSVWIASQRIYSCNYMAMYFTPNYLLLTAAVITTVVGLVGIYRTSCGSNEQVFRAFFIVLTVILAMETVSAIVAHIHNSILSEGELKTKMVNTFASYPDPLVQECVAETQKKFHCCGVNNFTDWLSHNLSQTQFPESCNCDKKLRCVNYQSLMSNTSVYKSSCYNRVFDKISSQLSVFQVIGPVLVALQLLLFCLVMYIVTRIQNSSTVAAYIVNYRQGSQNNSESSLSVSRSSMNKSGCCNILQEES